MNLIEQRPVTAEEVAAFVTDLNTKRRAYFVEQYPNLYAAADSTAYDDFELIVALEGPKNIKLVTSRKEAGYTGQKPQNGRFPSSAFVFIDKATGNILKPAGYNAAAKGVRGNIRDTDYWLKAVTPHGAAYLR